VPRVVVYRLAVKRAKRHVWRPTVPWHTTHQLHLSRACAIRHLHVHSLLVRQVYEGNEVPPLMWCSKCSLKGSTRNLIRKKYEARNNGTYHKWVDMIKTPFTLEEWTQDGNTYRLVPCTTQSTPTTSV
jgi:hypothetical protein